MSEKFAAFDIFGDMWHVTQEDIDAFRDVLTACGCTGFPATAEEIDEVMRRIDERKPKWNEWVTAFPVVTGEMLTENHAAGLPETRERITRCKDCRWAREAPPVEEWHLECRVRPLNRHYTPDDGFCHLGEPRPPERAPERECGPIDEQIDN